MQLVATLDRVRGRTYGYLLRVPGTRSIVRDKEKRLATLLVLLTLPALFIAATLPTFSLVVAPLVLGVPHLAADFRYLVMRPRWPRSLGWLTLAGSLAVLGLRGAELSTGVSLAVWEVGAAWLWCLGALLLAARRASPLELGGSGVLLLSLGALAIVSPEVTRLVFGYAHNLVAIVLWLTFFGGANRTSWFSLACVAAASLALLFGGSSWVPITQSLFGERLSSAGDWFAPASDWFAAPGMGPGLGLGIITSFAFLQSVHYALWLHVIPGQNVPGQRTRTFSQSLRSLREDFGLTGLCVVAGFTALTFAGLFVAPATFRTSYTSLSTFHGYLELAIGLYAFLVRRSLRSR